MIIGRGSNFGQRFAAPVLVGLIFLAVAIALQSLSGAYSDEAAHFVSAVASGFSARRRIQPPRWLSRNRSTCIIQRSRLVNGRPLVQSRSYRAPRRTTDHYPLLKKSRTTTFELFQIDIATDKSVKLLGIICVYPARNAALIPPADFFNTIRRWPAKTEHLNKRIPGLTAARMPRTGGEYITTYTTQRQPGFQGEGRPWATSVRMGTLGLLEERDFTRMCQV
jgi:hypothetical protein